MKRQLSADRPVTDGLDASDPRLILASAQLELAQRTAHERWSADLWTFLVDAVQTVDQITGRQRAFPPKPHLEYLSRLAMTEPLLAIPKSRRMMVTWWACSYAVWRALYRMNQKIVLFAKKEGKHEGEGSAELVWRCKFIMDHLPAVVAPPLGRDDYATGRLVVPRTGSEILGLAQGSEQARQMTVSLAILDEAAFYEWAYDTYIALRPTIEGGGQIIVMSSPGGPGWFKDCVFDDLDQAG